MNVGRPFAPGYRIPTHQANLLPWNHVEERLNQARNYWIVTIGADTSPHAVPIWGAWVNGVLYFGGIGSARWVHNVNSNPNALVHLESGNDVVILKGKVYEETDQAIVKAVDEVYYDRKYGGKPPEDDPDGGWLALKPRVVLSWTAFPDDATRWEFD